MSSMPGRDGFVELQRSLAAAIDDHAGELTARPTRTLVRT
jgi:hypothetical protein